MARYNLTDDETQGDPDAIRGLIQHAIDTGAFDMDLSRDPDVLGQSAWAGKRAELEADGPRDAVPHTIDPGDKMSPEEFEAAALRGLTGRDPSVDMDLTQDADVQRRGGWAAPPHAIDPRNEMSPEQFEATARRQGLQAPAPMSRDDFAADPFPRSLQQLQRAPITPMSRDEFIDDPEAPKSPQGEIAARQRAVDPTPPPPPTPEQYNDVAQRGLSPEAAQQRPSALQGGKIPVPGSSQPMNDPQAQAAAQTQQALPQSAPPGPQFGNLSGPQGEPPQTSHPPEALQATVARQEPMALRQPDTYTPDALRGLTGREPPPGTYSDDAPGVSPWAVLAAALSRNPGEALAHVMTTAAGQQQQWGDRKRKEGDQWLAQQRQDQQDADKRRYTDAQIRHLDRATQGASDWKADESAREWERIRLAGDAEGRRGTAADRALNPENAATQALVKGLVERSGGKLTAEDFAGMDDKAIGRFAHAINLQLDSANTPQKATDEATIARSRTNAEQSALIANAPALGAARGVGAAAAEETERPGKIKTTEQTTTARLGAEEPRRQQEKSEEFQAKFAKENDALLRARRVLGNVLSSAPEGGTPEGFGRMERLADKVGLGSTNTSKAQLNTQDIIEAATDVIHDRSGAAFSAREGAQNLLTIMGDPLASAEDRQGAVKHFLETVDSDLRGKSVRGKDAQAVVDRVGIPGLNVQSAPQERSSARRKALGEMEGLLQQKPAPVAITPNNDDDPNDPLKRWSHRER